MVKSSPRRRRLLELVQPSLLLGGIAILFASNSVSFLDFSSSFEFAFLLLLISFLLLSVFASKTSPLSFKKVISKRISLPTFLRALLLCFSTALWGYSASHVSSSILTLLLELAVFTCFHFPYTQVSFGVIAFFLLLFQLHSRYHAQAWFLFQWQLAIGIRHTFGLFQDGPLYALSSLMALMFWLGPVMVVMWKPTRTTLSEIGAEAEVYVFRVVCASIMVWLVHVVTFRESLFVSGFPSLGWKELNKDSKKIVYFLCLTASFMVVELVMGLYTNSLGLISDAGHMFFDSFALVIGLMASIVASKRKPDSVYTFGYQRFEVLAGFVNAIFLTFVSVFILSESLERFSSPPLIKTHGLLLTSVLGLGINVVGLVFFHDHHHTHAHAHDGGASCSHNNENLEGVFLHILADALGSVSVIVSSVLVEYKQWYIADPVCSFFVSLLIFASLVPLLKTTTRNLLLGIPNKDMQFKFAQLLERLKRRPHVLRINSAHLWQFSSDLLVSTVVFVMDKEVVDETEGNTVDWLRQALLHDVGANHVTIECQV